jgi:tripartite-type tricarboxylate transporter receptor subunit TctC
MRRLLACLALSLWPGAASHAGTFPERPIRLIVPWPAGGTSDAVLRPLAAAAAKQLGQPVVVENRAGANGTLGLLALIQAKPDGYTLSQLPVTVYTAAHTSGLSFNPVTDLTYIIHLTAYTFGLVVRADSPWKTFDELIAYARTHPNEITYGTSGPVSPGHVAMEQIAAARGVRFTHVPYKGVADATLAILGGHIHAVATSSGWGPQVEAGKLRLLATFGKARTKRWPRVATLRELGLAVVVESPYGLVGPRGMDPAVVKRLHDAFLRALDDPATQTAMGQFDQVKDYLGPADYAAYGRKLDAEQAAIVRQLGLQAQ